MKPLMVTDDPPTFPNICICCGLGRCPMRTFFIDLGFDIDNKYKAIYDGAVYLCDVCARDYLEHLTKKIAEGEARYGPEQQYVDGRYSDGHVPGQASRESTEDDREPESDAGDSSQQPDNGLVLFTNS